MVLPLDFHFLVVAAAFLFALLLLGVKWAIRQRLVHFSHLTVLAGHSLFEEGKTPELIPAKVQPDGETQRAEQHLEGHEYGKQFFHFATQRKGFLKTLIYKIPEAFYILLPFTPFHLPVHKSKRPRICLPRSNQSNPGIMESKSSSDPQVHTANIKNEFQELIDHLREDITKVDDPSAKALFETSAEVLIGLKKAFSDYEEKNEPAWQN